MIPSSTSTPEVQSPSSAAIDRLHLLLGSVLAVAADGTIARCARGDARRDLGLIDDDYEWGDVRHPSSTPAEERALERTVYLSPFLFAALIATLPSPGAPTSTVQQRDPDPTAERLDVDPLMDEVEPELKPEPSGPITSWTGVARAVNVSTDTLVRRRHDRDDTTEPFFATASDARRWYRLLLHPEPTRPTEPPRPPRPPRASHTRSRGTTSTTLAEIERRR